MKNNKPTSNSSIDTSVWIFAIWTVLSLACISWILTHMIFDFGTHVLLWSKQATVVACYLGLAIIYCLLLLLNIRRLRRVSDQQLRKKAVYTDQLSERAVTTEAKSSCHFNLLFAIGNALLYMGYGLCGKAQICHENRGIPFAILTIAMMILCFAAVRQFRRWRIFVAFVWGGLWLVCLWRFATGANII